MNSFRQLIAAAALGVGMALSSGTANAQDAAAGYPSGTITVVVPAAAGSQSDIFARRWAEMLQARFGKPVIVDNKPGAGGVLGAKLVADSAPDGLTLVYGSNSPIVISPQVRNPPPYDTTKVFSPIMIALKGQSLVVVNPNKVNASTAEELVAYAKEHPGELNFGSHGVGSFSHVATELFMKATGIEMQHIPYNGGGPLTAGFLAGEVDVVIFDVYSAHPHVTSGAARAVAQVGEERSPLFQDVPLVSETVAPDLQVNYYFGILAPAGTPKAIIDKLNIELTAILTTPEMTAEADRASMKVPGGSADEAAAEIARDWEIWGEIIKANNIVAE